MLDIIRYPQVYLTYPYNVTGFEHQCGITCDESYLYDSQHTDGFHWWVLRLPKSAAFVLTTRVFFRYDEIHPTQRTSVSKLSTIG